MGKNRKNKGLAVYSTARREPTPEEKERFLALVAKEKEKHDRDEKCGGLDENGGYTRLHDRFAP